MCHWWYYIVVFLKWTSYSFEGNYTKKYYFSEDHTANTALISFLIHLGTWYEKVERTFLYTFYNYYISGISNAEHFAQMFDTYAVLSVSLSVTDSKAVSHPCSSVFFLSSNTVCESLWASCKLLHCVTELYLNSS